MQQKYWQTGTKAFLWNSEFKFQSLVSPGIEGICLSIFADFLYSIMEWQKQKVRDIEKNLPSTSFLPKYLQQEGLGQESGTRLGFPRRGGDPSPLAVTRSLLG